MPASASGPLTRLAAATCCHSNRKRAKSRGSTGSISRRSLPSVARWMRISRCRSHHSVAPDAMASAPKRPCRTEPSPCSRSSVRSTSACASPSGAASSSSVTGPSPPRRARSRSRSASSRSVARWARSAGISIAGCSVAPRWSARSCARRSAPTQSAGVRAIGVSTVARPTPASSPSHCNQPGCRDASSTVTAPSEVSASCISSASRGRGHASARTVAIASGSRRPSVVGALRLVVAAARTACVRRSSSGASSRKA